MTALALVVALLASAGYASAQECYCRDGQPCICTNGQCYCADRSSPVFLTHPGGSLHVFLMRSPVSTGMIRYAAPVVAAPVYQAQPQCVWTGSGWDCSGNASSAGTYGAYGGTAAYGYSSRDIRHMKRAARHGYTYYSY